MSVFLGWMPDVSTLATLAALQREWQARVPDDAPRHHWRQPAQWHMTLRFLGESATDAQLAAIEQAMRVLAAELEAPVGRLEGVQYWPHANVLVACIVPTDALKRWLEGVDAAMQACGFPKVRAQTPHITLARLPRGRQPPAIAASPMSPGCDFRMQRIDLLRTVPGGYASLASWPLATDRMPG